MKSVEWSVVWERLVAFLLQPVSMYKNSCTYVSRRVKCVCVCVCV